MPKLEATVRREQVIRATYRAFIDKGATEVTLQDIADYAGCSKGVLAYHFHSKEEVYVALLEWLIGEIGKQVERNVGAASGAEAKMLALVNTVFLSARENRRFFLVYLDFMAQGLRHASFRSTNIAFYEMCRRVGAEIIEQGIAEGIYRPVDLEEAGTVLRAIFDGLAIQWIFDESGPAEETFERYKGWVLSSIRGYLGVRS
jgi:TetR/AcrR family transcriptional regulator, fatty acid metabolism regulator protein